MNEKKIKHKTNKKNLTTGIFLSLVILMTTFLPLASLIIGIDMGTEEIFIGTLRTSESEAWTANGADICTAQDNQQRPNLVSDGAGGAIITWKDNRSDTTGYDIYAQKINSAGITQWDDNGILICNAAGNQLNPQIASDGAGGAIITWTDQRGGSNQDDVYAQRINSAGAIQWDTNGVIISNAITYQNDQRIISDGAGGAIISWQDSRTYGSTYFDVYAQKINSAGITQWDANGKVICNFIEDQEEPRITSDGAGGAIITWTDERDTGTTDRDIYAQKINSAGITQWDTNGTIVCNAAGNQYGSEITSDGAEGAIITWIEALVNDIYAQKINSAGVSQWDDYWTLVCNATGNQQYPEIISDGAGGAIITWQDERVASDQDNIYTQKKNSIGVSQWDVNGTLICNATDNQQYPEIISDGAGGAIITWQDRRSGTSDICAQKINSTGSTKWDDNGKLICTGIDEQQYPQITSDNAGGAIIVWQDYRSSSTFDIYAQKIADPLPGGGGDGFPWLDLITFGLNTGLSFAIGLILGIFLMKKRK